MRPSDPEQLERLIEETDDMEELRAIVRHCISLRAVLLVRDDKHRGRIDHTHWQALTAYSLSGFFERS